MIRGKHYRKALGADVRCDVGAARHGRFADEQGSILPLLSFVFVGFACASALVVSVANYGLAEARAQTAADAAALAAAVEGEEAGRLLAEANGAKLLSFNTLGQPTATRSATVVVEVAVGKATAQAAAARFYVDPVTPGGSFQGGEDD